MPETSKSPPPTDDIMTKTVNVFYDPPYETPVHDEVAWHLGCYLSADCRLDYQVLCEDEYQDLTTWVDFIITTPDGRSVAVEINDDDADIPHTRRDEYVVSEGHVDALYRISRADATEHIHSALMALADKEPGLFSARGMTNLRTLAEPGPYEIDHGAARWDLEQRRKAHTGTIPPRHDSYALDLLHLVERLARRVDWSDLSDATRKALERWRKKATLGPHEARRIDDRHTKARFWERMEGSYE